MDERELTTLGQLLAERICGTNEVFCFQLLRLLGQGRPVSAAQIGAALGISEIAVTETFERMPDIERDERGQVVGWGLSLRTTSHQFRINGHTLYTWCALDALTYPILLEQTAQVESVCPITQTPIRLSVGLEEITALDPATAMVSLSILIPTQMPAIGQAFATRGTFSPRLRLPRPGRRIIQKHMLCRWKLFTSLGASLPRVASISPHSSRLQLICRKVIRRRSLQ